MAGPTPVSALIHAATMVTAGVYLVVRANAIYQFAPTAMWIIAVVGAATALFAATIAIAQNDIKKVLAYSTVSQLGFMFLAAGVGAFVVAIFHVMTHAFFKALLFLGSGSVIHGMHHEQDMRKMGNLKKYMPITFATMVTGWLAICGIPFFAGFFSKDEILSKAYMQNDALFFILSLTSVLTAIYMFRLLFLTFFGSFRGTPDQEHHLHESPPVITVPLVVLAILSTIGGFLGMPAVFSGHHLFGNYLEPVITHPAFAGHAEPSHFFEYMLMGISVAVAAIAIFIAVRKYSKRPELGEPQGLGKVLSNKWYVDELYNSVIVYPLGYLGSVLKNVVEKSGIDGLVNGVGAFIQYSSRRLRLVQNGRVGNYILLMVFSILILWLVFWNQAIIVSFFQKIF